MLETDFFPSFAHTLEKHGLSLERASTHTLQVNVGLLCNLACKHCHLEAGPARTELMSKETMGHVIEYAKRVDFHVIDVTGGAPEMVPGIAYLLDELAPLAKNCLFRSNLVALSRERTQALLRVLVKHKVSIVASFPSTNAGQADAQRGKGVWDKSVLMLQHLNELGYGKEGTGLVLDLVANPTGAFLPPAQASAEKKYKKDLQRKCNVVFNNLYTFANMPLGRYRSWLEQTGNYQSYIKKLADAFNPCTLDGLMCRTLVSVNWDGILHDCDFNIASKQPLSGNKHVSEMQNVPEPGTRIATGEHCYGCTAGSGFT